MRSRRCVVEARPAARGSVVAKASLSDMDVKTKTAVYFFLWYFFNIVFNVYNKSTLNVFPYPWLISTLQLAATSLWMLTVWATKVQPKPVVSKGVPFGRRSGGFVPHHRARFCLCEFQ